MSPRSKGVLSLLLLPGALALACTLNPQPLPPGEDEDQGPGDEAPSAGGEPERAPATVADGGVADGSTPTAPDAGAPDGG